MVLRAQWIIGRLKSCSLITYAQRTIRLRAESAELKRRLADLETAVQDLKDQLATAQQAGKRQTVPFLKAPQKRSPRNRAMRSDILPRIAPRPSRSSGSERRYCRQSVQTVRDLCWKMKCWYNIGKTSRVPCRLSSLGSTCISGITRSASAERKDGILIRRRMRWAWWCRSVRMPWTLAAEMKQMKQGMGVSYDKAARPLCAATILKQRHLDSQISKHDYALACGRLDAASDQLLVGHYINTDNTRVAKLLRKQRPHLEIRPTVLMRKTHGCNRNLTSILTSVICIGQKYNQGFVNVVKRVLRPTPVLDIVDVAGPNLVESRKFVSSSGALQTSSYLHGHRFLSITAGALVSVAPGIQIPVKLVLRR